MKNSVRFHVRDINFVSSDGAISQSLQQPGFSDAIADCIFDDKVSYPYAGDGKHGQHSQCKDLLPQDNFLQSSKVHKNLPVLASDPTAPFCSPPPENDKAVSVPADTESGEGVCTIASQLEFAKWVDLDAEAYAMAKALFQKSKFGSPLDRVKNRLMVNAHTQWHESVHQARKFGCLLFLRGAK